MFVFLQLVIGKDKELLLLIQRNRG